MEFITAKQARGMMEYAKLDTIKYQVEVIMREIKRQAAACSTYVKVDKVLDFEVRCVFEALGYITRFISEENKISTIIQWAYTNLEEVCDKSQ